MAQTRHNLRLHIAKEQARSKEEGALTCKKQTDPENFVKYSHDENCLINARRRRILTIRNPFACSNCSARLKGREQFLEEAEVWVDTWQGAWEGPDGHVSEPSLSRVPILWFWEGFVQLQVHTKAFVGTPVGLIERGLFTSNTFEAGGGGAYLI